MDMQTSASEHLTVFDCRLPAHLRWGRGCVEGLGAAALGFGKNALIVHGRQVGRIQSLLDALTAQGLEWQGVICAGEPDLALILKMTETAKAGNIDLVIAIGGGSVIDAGKAVAALATATRDPMDHLEVVGKGLPLDHHPLPLIAVPTTSGTGAEVTKNAVISLPNHQRKVSLRDVNMLPNLALVDPALTDDCPWPVTLAAGLDAITQVIEPWLSCKSNPFTDALCADAIPRGLSALLTLQREEHKNARDNLSLTSLYGGIALANSGLGVVHGLAGVIGGVTGAAHGAICGRLLVPALRLNTRLIPGDDALRTARLQQINAWLAVTLQVPQNDALDTFETWINQAGLPRLTDMGMQPDMLTEIAHQSQNSSSMKGNPVPPETGHLETLMTEAM